jgi:hypothetical protein
MAIPTSACAMTEVAGRREARHVATVRRRLERLVEDREPVGRRDRRQNAAQVGTLAISTS